MKKLVFVLIFLGAYLLPTIAQYGSDGMINEKVSIVTARITKDKIPAAIIKTANMNFDKDNPFTWSKFPRELKEFGWVYEVGSNPDHPLSGFKVTMKTTSGRDLQANYDVNGKLTESRERSTNIPVPLYILSDLAGSEYKDWTIIGNKEVIQFYSTGDKPTADQYFRLILQKGSEKRKLAYRYEANTGKFQTVAYNLK